MDANKGWLVGCVANAPWAGDHVIYDLALRDDKAQFNVPKAVTAQFDLRYKEMVVKMESHLPPTQGGHLGLFWYFHLQNPQDWRRYRLFNPDGTCAPDLWVEFELRLDFAQTFAVNGIRHPAPEESELFNYSSLPSEIRYRDTWFRLASPSFIRGPGSESLFCEYDFFNSRRHDATEDPRTTFENASLVEKKLAQQKFLKWEHYRINLSEEARAEFFLDGPPHKGARWEDYAIVAWYPVIEWMGRVRGSYRVKNVRFFEQESRGIFAKDIVTRRHVAPEKIEWLSLRGDAKSLFRGAAIESIDHEFLPGHGPELVGDGLANTNSVLRREEGAVLIKLDYNIPVTVDTFYLTCRWSCVVREFEVYVRVPDDEGDAIPYGIEGYFAKIHWGRNAAQQVQIPIGPLELIPADSSSCSAFVVLKEWCWTQKAKITPAWLAITDLGFRAFG